MSMLGFMSEYIVESWEHKYPQHHYKRSLFMNIKKLDKVTWEKVSGITFHKRWWAE